MGFGFRGQSDNLSIIRSAVLYASGQPLSPNIKTEVKQILENEIKARKIEYATLVGKDFKIIVNANANREGEVFNPDNLVSEVFSYPRQIKATRLVNWSELSKESPPLPKSFSKQDALIRYTITPVRDPTTQIVVGALVSGDIVNGKNPIVKETLKATEGGYSAIYLRKSTGEFVLATSLNQDPSQDVNRATPNVALPKEGLSLLEAAATAPEGKTVTGRMKVGNQTYTMAAKAVPNKIIEAEDNAITILDDNPVGVLVRGTPETALNQLLEKSFWIELFAVIVALVIIFIWAYILRQGIIAPIQNLKHTTQKFATGDHNIRAKIFATDEIGQLAFTFNAMADSITTQVSRQENDIKIAQIVNQMTLRCRASLETEHILNAAVTITREAIKVDRVMVYHFNENWQGRIIAEAVGTDVAVILGTVFTDSCFAKEYVEKYQKGRIQAVENIYTANLTQCHLAQLEEFGVKANLVVPIIINNKLHGLLIAHQCNRPRRWQKLEIDFLKQVTIPIGYTLEHAHLQEQVDKAYSLAELVSGAQSQEQTALQQQIQKLLQDIAVVSRGDLTARAEVTSGGLGVVAKFFNSIVESLQMIIAKVQTSANRVNTAIRSHEGAIQQQVNEVIKQAATISCALNHVEDMTFSVQNIAEKAQQAAIVAQKSADTAQESSVAMELTVQNIFNWRSTIDDIAKKVKRLGESSQEVSHVVVLMNQIAMQTNLLAINAGLEAARTDRESPALALVVEDVSELASRCAQTTQEIQQIVDSIQQETREVVKAMELGTTKVVEGTSLIEDAKVSLNQILNISRQVNELVQSIGGAMVSQVEISQALTHSIKEISQGSEILSQESSKISQTLQQTMQSSQELQADIENFKIN
ncbi:MAG: GAF domain-containing protein [Scytonema sp. RU_4_4]|nr:GAF domain-containing protein [Scytonema sp. RU_4_4]